MTPPRSGKAAALGRIEPAVRDRKREHLQLALQEQMQLESNFFDAYDLEHQALPEIDYDAIDPSVRFLGRRLSIPLLISCMTGGTRDATRINRNLACGAEAAGVAIGVGSQRKAFEDPATIDSFRIRPFAPSVPILANLGAVQLNYGFGIDECRRAVEMIDADALVLHLNPLQEAIQPEGQRDFSRLVPKMAEVAEALDVPVVVKEVGCGVSAGVARRLQECGIRIIDTAGTGGTNWARIEAARAGDPEIGELFSNWGIPTPQAIRRLSEIPDLTVIGSGGVRNGLDGAKAIALGADLFGMACPFLHAADHSTERVADKIRRTEQELTISMFCVGVSTVAQLKTIEPIERAEVRRP